MTMTDSIEQILAEYQEWVQRVLDARDTYGSREYGYQSADELPARLVPNMLEQPNILRPVELPYPTRVVDPPRLSLNDESHPSELTRSVLCNQIEDYLRRCPEVLQVAVVCAIVHGDTIERMTERTGWSRQQARRFRAEAVEYLRKADDAARLEQSSSRRGALATAMVEPEQSSYPPSALFAAQANAGLELCERASTDRLKFWAEQARELLWDSNFGETLDWSNAPFARWFVGGTINVAVNCIDRHVAAGKGDRVAIHWVGEPGDSRDITYRQLQGEVSKAANYFTDMGLTAGDRAAIYLPMIPEAIVAMLACARLGLVHLVVFAGLSSEALRSQVDDAQAKVVITSDGHYRRGAPIPLKGIVDEALAAGDAPCDSVETVIVVRRTGHDPELNWVTGRDVWWQDTVGAAPEQHEAQSFDAEHPLFLLYTSGTAGTPKGIVHSSGGYLTQARYTFHYVFDHKEGRDVFWCGADLGSIAGHSYLVYGPLADGATSVIYEGAADFPDERRHFQIIEDYGVTTYYVAPTLIRTFMKWGRDIPDAHDLSTLRLLGTMAEGRNPDAWRWYRDVIGGSRCPIVDTWWQTETGAVMIAPLPGVTAAKPGSPMTPLPGISAHIVDDDGDLVALGEQGHLVLDRPWPSMLRGIWGDDKRFVETYWSRFGERGWCFTGVDARYDDADAIWALGRGDDVMNVAGHHISNAELEAAPGVAVARGRGALIDPQYSENPQVASACRRSRFDALSDVAPRGRWRAQR